jgi:Acetyltransferase (GNAT) family
MQQSFVADYLFYKQINKYGQNFNGKLPVGVAMLWWTPNITNLVAPKIGLSIKTLGLTVLSLFTPTRKCYGTLLLMNDVGMIVHRTKVLTKTPHFPFMKWDDLQISIWTHPGYQRQGLATLGVSYVLASEQMANQSFWYIVKKNNSPSIRVAEKCGFGKYAEGHRTKPLGISLAGSFVIDRLVDNEYPSLVPSLS